MFSLRNTAITLAASLFLVMPTLAKASHAASGPAVPVYSAVAERGLDASPERRAEREVQSTQSSIACVDASEDSEIFLTYSEYLDYLEQLDQMGLLELFAKWAEEGYSEPEGTWCEADDIQCIYSGAVDHFDTYLAYIEYLDYLRQLDHMGLLDFFLHLSEPGFSDFEEQVHMFDSGEVIVSAVT